MIRRYLAAALFAACMICAPIFTEAIAAPTDQHYIIHDQTSPAVLPADTFTATPVRFCAVLLRSSTDTKDMKKNDTIASVHYHLRC